MSLQFVFGPSGAGKSRQLYEEILRRGREDLRAGAKPDASGSPEACLGQRNSRRNYFIIVPDQFTMQTQKELATLSEQGGIMNIDVLSFGRLGHRILEEVGWQDMPVLDDTGKSLVLQKVAASLKEELPALGSLLHRQGYIHEVKSALSEFMQYGISPEDVDQLIACAEKRGALVHKLKDLQTIYKGFKEYIRENFITTEEKLDVLRRSLHKSRILPGSVVVFDGFTGFTPIQNRLIQELMTVCDEVIVTLTLGQGEDPYRLDGEQKLFHLSKKTVADLEKLAEAAGVSRKQDIFVGGGARFREAPALDHLEKNLFRPGTGCFVGEQQELQMFEALTPKEEVHQTALYIRELTRQEGMAYRDMAVIVGDLEGYAPHVEAEFAQLGIPCFIDRTRGIVLNPMIEYIKSALALFLKDFSYESVFHYLRSGMADMDREDVDRLENYVIETGIRGYHRWSRLFTHKTVRMGEDEEPLKHLNRIRQQFMDQVAVLGLRKTAAEKAETEAGEAQRGNCKTSRRPARDYVDALYDFLTANQVQQKLLQYELFFTEQGDLSKAREYAQIYRLVMELLEQVYRLLGEEEITLQEFADILEAGFGEIEVGTIPQNVDRVVVGDMERTRLKQVKALFFLGVNDGNIPKSASKGGIISDIDREFLTQSGLELAPSPRQQMYIQRLYLYMNMTKPSHKLYLSFARMNSAGKSIRPAYLIDTVKRLFPEIKVQYPQNRSRLEQIVTPGEGLRYLAESLREYAQGTLQETGETEFFTVYQAYGTEDPGSTENADGTENAGSTENPGSAENAGSTQMYETTPVQAEAVRARLTEAAFKRYQDSGLSQAVARALYGYQLMSSVTRLETYAACAYRHFLQYGLSLKEREEFGFETVDMGNVYHGVLENFAGKLAENGYTWFDFPEEFAGETVKTGLEAYAATYGATVLYSSARNEYAITRMERVLTRTVLTLQNHLKKGVFTPEQYEMSFQYADKLESIHVTLSPQEKMHLQGRIDRIDVAEDEDYVYVKVIDYKSGNKQFDLAALYYGLQLQLVVYLNAAVEMEAHKHPDKEIVPAALLYYHVDDPTVETAVELSDEELNQEILGKLRMNGVVNAEPDIVERLDKYLQDKSDVIPVERKKDGTFSARSSVMSCDELQMVSDFVNRKVKKIGREILDGRISMDPYEKGTAEACTYCSYKKVCGFDSQVPGYEKRKLAALSKDEAMEKIMKQDDETGTVLE